MVRILSLGPKKSSFSQYKEDPGKSGTHILSIFETSHIKKAAIPVGMFKLNHKGDQFGCTGLKIYFIPKRYLLKLNRLDYRPLVSKGVYSSRADSRDWEKLSLKSEIERLF